VALITAGVSRSSRNKEPIKPRAYVSSASRIRASSSHLKPRAVHASSDHACGANPLETVGSEQTTGMAHRACRKGRGRGRAVHGMRLGATGRGALRHHLCDPLPRPVGLRRWRHHCRSRAVQRSMHEYHATATCA
jgi:hypothetical protein